MKAIYFTLSEIDAALRAHKEVPGQMSSSIHEAEQSYRHLYDKFLRAIERTNEDIRRAQRDRSVVNEAISTTEDAIDKLQAIADAPAPEGQQKPPPPKDLARAKKNIVRLRAIKKEIDSAIRALESQLYQQKLHKDYLMNAYGNFYNVYNTHSSIVGGIVSSASTAASAARGAMSALGASGGSRMECDSPSYLSNAASYVEHFADRITTVHRNSRHHAAEFGARLIDNVSRNSIATYKSVCSTIDRQAQQVRSHSGQLRQAASYLQSYLNAGR